MFQIRHYVCVAKLDRTAREVVIRPPIAEWVVQCVVLALAAAGVVAAATTLTGLLATGVAQATAIAIAAVAVAVRFGFVRCRLTSWGMEVRNVFTSFRLPWSEIYNMFEAEWDIRTLFLLGLRVRRWDEDEPSRWSRPISATIRFRHLDRLELADHIAKTFPVSIGTPIPASGAHRGKN